jgi:DNA-binding IclR family transcriptional regulator
MKQSLDRVFDIIELLADRNSAIAVTDVAQELGMPASGAHRILALMQARALVEQDPATRGYRLSLKFASLGLRLLSGSSFHAVVQPVLDRYANATGELIRLAVEVEDGKLAWIANAQGSRAQLRVDPMAGHQAVPHLTAAGKAWLAYQTDDVRTRVLAQRRVQPSTESGSSRKPVRLARLQRDLAACRAEGYAVTMDDIEPGLSAVAAPVLVTMGPAPRAVAAVSIAGPSLRMPLERLPGLGGQMIAAAKELAGVWELLGTSGSRLPR